VGEEIEETRCREFEAKFVPQFQSWPEIRKDACRFVQHTGDKQSGIHIIELILQAPASEFNVQQKMVDNWTKISEAKAGKEVAPEPPQEERESIIRHESERTERMLQPDKDGLRNLDLRQGTLSRQSEGRVVSNLLLEYTTVGDDLLVEESDEDEAEQRSYLEPGYRSGLDENRLGYR
jgi:hypothetical protein